MISCIFTTSFYDIVIFVDSITNTTTIIGNLQTNSCLMPRALNKVSQIVKRGGGKSPPVRWGESEILVGGGICLLGGENLRRSDFNDSNYFQDEKSILWVLNIN